MFQAYECPCCGGCWIKILHGGYIFGFAHLLHLFGHADCEQAQFEVPATIKMPASESDSRQIYNSSLFLPYCEEDKNPRMSPSHHAPSNSIVT